MTLIAFSTYHLFITHAPKISNARACVVLVLVRTCSVVCRYICCLRTYVPVQLRRRHPETTRSLHYSSHAFTQFVAAMSSTTDTRSSVFFTPVTSRPSMVSSPDDSYPEFYVETICPPFLYTIPSFDVLSVKLRQLKTVGRDEDRRKTSYDIFIRSDESIPPTFPALLMVKDAVVVQVSYNGIHILSRPVV